MVYWDCMDFSEWTGRREKKKNGKQKHKCGK